MIELSNKQNKDNIKILFKGMWDRELPDILDVDTLCDRLPRVMEYINEQECQHYKFDDNFIKEFNIGKGEVPSYIHQQGSEAVSYYGFKDNGSWRELQISNLIFYMAFIHNTMYVYEDLFKELYMQDYNKKIIKNSNSYLMSEYHFVEYGYWEEVEYYEGNFINNSKKYREVYSENQKRFLHAENMYIYSIQLDIESFFPNIYTHYLEKMSDRKPFNSWKYDVVDYFEFLDKYNMKINSNQTKGIPAGMYSSSISSELLMICVDSDIRENILNSENINYMRFVDDLNFYSDSKAELENIVHKVQKVLNNYRLRINGFKTKTNDCVMIVPQESISELYINLPFLDFSENELVLSFKWDYFHNLKRYIADCIKKENLKQIKTTLTNLYHYLLLLSNDTLKVEESYQLEVLEMLFNYLLKLVWIKPKLTYHCYNLIEIILNIFTEFIESNENIEAKEQKSYDGLINKLKNRRSLVNENYSETIMQIWHYHVMLKYTNEKERNDLLRDNTYNPIITSMFVQKGDMKNRKIFNYILKEYNKIDSDESQNGWKNTIMFSKWWLPLFKIKINDQSNYHGFMESEHFPEVLKEFII